MTEGTCFTDLETKGFVVVPGFLSADEVAAFRADFDSRPIDGNKNYKLKTPSPEADARMRRRVEEVLALVNAGTALKVDAPQGGCYFATGRATGVNFPWHQDHESFFELQNHFDYLNFYVPIVKPARDKSNLSIVPFDVLQRESPKVYPKLVRGGATRFVRLGATRLAVCDDRGTVHVLPKDMDALAHTPHLGAGDLLLLRGDVIHRTQDAETERVALSFRAANDATLIRRSRLASGGMQKAMMMANNPLPYQRMFKAFAVAGKDALPVGELRTLMEQVGINDPDGHRTFYKHLLKEKVRAGAVSRFVVSAATMYALVGVGKAYARYHHYRSRFGR